MGFLDLHEGILEEFADRAFCTSDRDFAIELLSENRKREAALDHYRLNHARRAKELRRRKAVAAAKAERRALLREQLRILREAERQQRREAWEARRPEVLAKARACRGVAGPRGERPRVERCPECRKLVAERGFCSVECRTLYWLPGRRCFGGRPRKRAA